VFSRWIKARDKVLAAAGIKIYYTCREQASFHTYIFITPAAPSAFACALYSANFTTQLESGQ
jgi:hypothetical protein